MTRILSTSAIATLLTGLFVGCTTQQSPQPPILPDASTLCPQPRAESADQVICPMNYQPVCALYRQGIRKARTTYGNACGACAESQITGYTEGVCP